MREKLNSNPLVQAALIGVLALGVGLMLLMRMGGGAEPAPTDTATTPAATTATDPTAAPAVDPATGTAAPATSASPSVPADAASADFKPGPGLPKDVVDAYDQGKAVVLLIVSKGGIDDSDIKVMVETLRSRPDAAVFVTDVTDVARYSRITQGVDVNRTPALIVVRPKSLSDGQMPTAVVSYGFRGETSVKQALDDALYKGPANLPYYP
jgi:hypothetical protein